MVRPQSVIFNEKYLPNLLINRPCELLFNLKSVASETSANHFKDETSFRKMKIKRMKQFAKSPSQSDLDPINCLKLKCISFVGRLMCNCAVDKVIAK